MIVYSRASRIVQRRKVPGAWEYTLADGTIAIITRPVYFRTTARQRFGSAYHAPASRFAPEVW